MSVMVFLNKVLVMLFFFVSVCTCLCVCVFGCMYGGRHVCHRSCVYVRRQSVMLALVFHTVWHRVSYWFPLCAAS